MSSARSRRVAFAGGLVLVVAAAVSPVLAADGDVSIAGVAFEPASVTINVGDTVTWTVTESIGQGHSVTSGTAADPGSDFDSGIGDDANPILKDNGQTFEHTFDAPGEFAYFCQIHPTMTGTVIVLAEDASAPPADASGAPGAEPSGEPGAEPSGEPAEPEEDHPPVPTERKVLAGAILAVGLVLMFGMAWAWRRMNPA